MADNDSQNWIMLIVIPHIDSFYDIIDQFSSRLGHITTKKLSL